MAAPQEPSTPRKSPVQTRHLPTNSPIFPVTNSSKVSSSYYDRERLHTNSSSSAVQMSSEIDISPQNRPLQAIAARTLQNSDEDVKEMANSLYPRFTAQIRLPPAQVIAGQGHDMSLMRAHQIMTPESSPFTVKQGERTPRPILISSAFPSNLSQPPPTTSAKPPSSSNSPPGSASTAPSLSPVNSRIQPYAQQGSLPTSRPHTPPSQSHSQTPSQLSSPFMARPLLPPSSSSTKGPVFVDDVFGPGLGSSSASTKATSPPSSASSSHENPPQPLQPPPAHFSRRDLDEMFVHAPGGELERIRQRQLVEHAAVEARRPDYFVREGKRKADASDDSRSNNTSFTHSSNAKPHPSGVGIMDSPTKGRRIKLYNSSAGSANHSTSDHTKDKIKLFPDMKLFQETSEESFEESLMAGGYGRYRTAEWVRQPQPIPIEVLQAQVRHGPSVNPAASGSPIVKRLEDQSVAADRREEAQGPGTPHSDQSQPQALPLPPTEKELRKRKRLDAFRVLTSSSAGSCSSPTAVTVNDSDHDFVNKNTKPSSTKAGAARRESPRKLYPLELEGRGRVLVDVLPGSHNSAPGADDVFVQDVVAGAKRKKRATAIDRRDREVSPEYPYGLVVSPSKKRAIAGPGDAKAVSAPPEKPNWPDAEFPWRIREEEREEEKIREEEERLKRVEKFLERDDDESDLTDSDDNVSSGKGKGKEDEDEILASSQLGVVYDDDRLLTYRAGRGKMVPLIADTAPEAGKVVVGDVDKPPPAARRKRGSMYFPSDPADARAALLSKRSVRALSFKMKSEAERKRKIMVLEARGEVIDPTELAEEEEEVPCICDGEGANFDDDDARGVIQCDGCDQWFHFGCMGMRSNQVADDEQWYCPTCMPFRHSEPEPQEPVFVPTDVQEAGRRLGADPMLFNSRSPRESPGPEGDRGLPPVPPFSPRGGVMTTPKTPTRKRTRVLGNEYLDSDFPSSSSSRYSYIQPGSSHSTNFTSGSTRGYPTTPRHRLSRTEPRIHGHDVFLGVGSSFDESPAFDPTSTPSRGIKFNPPSFATPTRKPSNARGLLTPSRKSIGGFGGPGFLSSALDDKGDHWFGYGHGGDESPIRRKKSSASSDVVAKSKRVLDGLLAAAAPGAGGGLAEGFDDSSLGRSPGRARRLE
ncbi:hypothetical protein V5O48_003463 [Marasmius crinis-equi]|uniref:PHD-type domain-containing protein n=1 Tax=Marasmius crinis-equi TaxID=585013 RepID=A0ABR3FSR0_9AGAR